MSELAPLLPHGGSVVPGRKTRALYGFLAAAFLYYIAITHTVPARPALILEAAGDASKAALFTGLVDAVQAVIRTMTAPLLGSLADVAGRVPVLSVCISVEAIALLIVALLHTSLSGQLAGYALAAASDAFLLVCLAVIADLAIDNDASTRGYALLGAIQGAALMIGPIIGGITATRISTEAPLYLSGLLLLVTAPVVLRIPDPRPPSASSTSFWESARSTARNNPFAKIRDTLLDTDALALLSAAYAVLNFAQAAVISMMYLFFNAAVGWESLQYGTFVALVGLAQIISQALFAAPFARFFGEHRLVVVGVLFLVVNNLWLTQVTSGVGIWTSIFFLVPYCIAGPAMRAAFARQVEGRRQGSLQGALSAVGAVMTPPSVLLFGAAFATCQSFGNPGAIFYATAVLNLVSAALFHLAFRHPHLK